MLISLKKHNFEKEKKKGRGILPSLCQNTGNYLCMLVQMPVFSWRSEKVPGWAKLFTFSLKYPPCYGYFLHMYRVTETTSKKITCKVICLPLLDILLKIFSCFCPSFSSRSFSSDFKFKTQKMGKIFRLLK